ncbi:3-ketoacyl-CoA synthase [Corchorus olitorius]|uniref:3-ketoacyl-CoA synthase n=1 Tax=Corchorus olitorius TaxID=93759 RepID=A0A1R3JP42_9ROSI|nr:3-ketoacyl-CoA synthase [Corchorus olitorius]
MAAHQEGTKGTTKRHTATHSYTQCRTNQQTPLHTAIPEPTTKIKQNITRQTKGIFFTKIGN